MKRPVYLEEEQIALLTKMYVRSAANLNARERQVYEQLVESITQRLDRRKASEGNGKEEEPKSVTGSISRYGTKDVTVEQKTYRSKMMAIAHSSAPEVVRTFVECWNTGDFELEYACLSKKFKKGGRGNLGIFDYAERRHRKHEVRESSNCVEKRIEKVDLIESFGSRAKVETTEVYIGSQDETTYTREYYLVHEEGAWKVEDFVDVSVRKAARTATVGG